MPREHGTLSKHFCEQLFGELNDLIKSDSGLTDRLFRSRQILEELYKGITSHAGIAFTGLYARMQYMYEASAISAEMNEQLQLLRLLTNKVIHKDDVDFGEQDFQSAVKILYDTICSLSCDPALVSPDLAAFLIEKKPKSLTATKTTAESTVAHIFGLVTDWKCSTAKDSNNWLEISCQSDAGREIVVTLWEKADYDNCGRKWTALDKALWKYCNISFYHLSLVHGNLSRYQSTPLTMVVLEQDFLMDVSSIADCFQQRECYPELFLMNKFFSEPVTEALSKGKCVNYIFDELITNPERKLLEIFEEYLEQNQLQVFSLGKKAWQDIYKQIEQDHFAQLQAIAGNLAKQSCQLEPSFISVKHGLHGRLDAMTMPDCEAGKYSILELKSGSAPANDVWKGHQMQVVGYNLILKEVFGITNIASSSIFYSRSNVTPLRHVVNHITLEQDFLMCRNRIIGMLFKMATKPETFINWLKNNPRQYANSFITDKAMSLSSTIRSISDKEYKWFLNVLGFIFREIWAVKTGAFCESESSGLGFSALWNSSPAEKKKQYRIIDGLWIESITEEKLIFRRHDNSTLSSLREGDIIVLYKQTVPITQQQLIRGTITVLNDSVVEVRTRSKIKPEGVFDNYTLWAIEPDLMESSLYGCLSSIHTFLSSGQDIRAKLLGYTPPESEQTNVADIPSWRTDVSESLKGMLAAKDYYLVQGPPGTGKTSCLLLQYLLHLLSETDKKLLVLAYTNRAVDEICAHLDKEDVDYIRLGGHKPAGGGHSDHETRTGSHKVVFLNPESRYENCRMFVSTLHSFSAVASDMLNKITIDEMIIDEASQILEHHIIGLMSRIKKTILIGDQNQLPPIILQHTDKERVSILEKLINNADKRIFPTCYSMLTNHYRMHNDITKLIGDNYHNKLIADSKRQTSDAPWLKTNDEFLAPILKSRIVWIETQPSQQSKADTMQAEWIKVFLEKLSLVMPIDDICAKVGIITPFRAQAQCLISTLGAKYNGLTVDTVERYQGSQRDCIIMSYPIKYHYEISMLQSVNHIGTIDRKLNVAISRAREQLIILGSSKMLVQSEFFHKVYSLIKKHGVIVNILSKE
jgi:DNA replication ATP-dependent helicase Dna2